MLSILRGPVVLAGLVACSDGSGPLPIVDTGPQTDPNCPGPGYRLCYAPPEPEPTDPPKTVVQPPPQPGRLDLVAREHVPGTFGAPEDDARFFAGDMAWLGGVATARRQSNTVTLSYRASQPWLDGFDSIDLQISGLPLQGDERLAAGTYDCAASGSGRLLSRKQQIVSGWAEVIYETGSGGPCRVTVAEDLVLAGPDVDEDGPQPLRGSLSVVFFDVLPNDHQVTFEGTFSGEADE